MEEVLEDDIENFYFKSIFTNLDDKNVLKHLLFLKLQEGLQLVAAGGGKPLPEQYLEVELTFTLRFTFTLSLSILLVDVASKDWSTIV